MSATSVAPSEAPVPMRGIVNQIGDNYCYLNAVVQMIVRCRALRAELTTNVLPMSTSAGSNHHVTPETVIVCDESGTDRPSGGGVRTISDIDTEVFTDAKGLEKTPKRSNSGVAAPKPAPPCAASAMRTTIIEYMRPENIAVPLQLQELRQLVSHAEQTFARGNMNDASELFEKLLYLVDRDVWWHQKKKPAGEEEEEEEGPSCVPYAKLLEDYENTERDVSGVARALGYSFEQRWTCTWEGCSERLVPKTKHLLDYVCRLIVYPMLYDDADKPRHDLGFQSADYHTFGSIACSSVMRNETFVCPSCGERTVAEVSRLWLPQSLSALHLLWHRIPTPTETEHFLLRVLEDTADVGEVWDTVLGVRRQEESTRRRGFPLVGIVVFQGSHYVALVRSTRTGEEWNVLNDAKAVEKLSGWEGVILYIIKKRFVPLMLFYDMEEESTSAPSSRPTWNSEDIRLRLQPPPKQKKESPAPSLALKSSPGPWRQTKLKEFYNADKVNFVSAVEEMNEEEVLVTDEEGGDDDGGVQLLAILEKKQPPRSAADEVLNLPRRKRERTPPHEESPMEPRPTHNTRDKISRLREFTGNNFSIQQMEEALRRNGDNEDAAIEFLFEGSNASRPSPVMAKVLGHVNPAVSRAAVQSAMESGSAVDFMTRPDAQLEDIMRSSVQKDRSRTDTGRRRDRAKELTGPSQGTDHGIFKGKHFYTVLRGDANETNLRAVTREIVKFFGGKLEPLPAEKASKFDCNSEYILTTFHGLERLARDGSLKRSDFKFLADSLEKRDHIFLDINNFAKQCMAVMDEIKKHPDSQEARRNVANLRAVLDDAQIRTMCEAGGFNKLIRLGKELSTRDAADLTSALRFARHKGLASPLSSSDSAEQHESI